MTEEIRRSNAERVVEKAPTEFRGATREFRIFWMELHHRELAEEFGLLRDDLPIYLDAFASSAVDSRFELERIASSVLPLQPNVKMIGFETDEFSAAMTSRRAAEREKSHGLQEVGFSLSIPSQKDIDLGRNVQLDFL